MELNLVINEIPVPASRPIVARWGTYIAEPYKSYKKYVEQLGKEQFKNKHFEQGIALSVDIKFYRPIQKSISKVEYSRRLNNEHLPTVKPDIDNYEFGINEDLTEELLNALKYKYPKYSFSIMPWHNIGFDLLITDIQRQKAYDLLPKTKTMKDVADEIERNGVKTDILFHCNPDEKITEQEYKEFVASWKGTLDD